MHESMMSSLMREVWDLWEVRSADCCESWKWIHELFVFYLNRSHTQLLPESDVCSSLLR